MTGKSTEKFWRFSHASHPADPGENSLIAWVGTRCCNTTMPGGAVLAVCGRPSGQGPTSSSNSLPAERVNDCETPSERIYCRGVVQVCGLLVDFRAG